MPKFVDHDQRRAEIVERARQVIGTDGVEGLTLRRLADECGLANGALRRYFRFKQDVMMALDADIARRIARHAESEGYASKRGIEALQVLLDAMLPLDAERHLSVEVLVALRDHAVADDAFSAAFSRRMSGLFDQIVIHLEQAHEDSQISGTRRIEVTAAILVNTVIGIGMTSTVKGYGQMSKYESAAVTAILESA